MNFKQFSTSDNQWHDIPYYQHKTATDTLTLPAVIYPNDTSITVGIKGNTTQSGTPSPQNPVMPNGTGERTKNLFDKDATNVNNGYIDNGYVRPDGSINTNTDYRVSEYIRISQNQQYNLRYGTYLNNPSVCFYDSAKNYISGVAYAGRWDVPFTTPQNAEYLRLSFRAVDVGNIKLNEGSTALPYEPYGYKIPISSASTTTLVYLGEVETTRRVRELVLTGDETYTTDTPYSRFITVFPNAKIEGLRLTQVFCTHFISVYDGRPISEVPNNSIYSSDVTVDRFFIKTTDYTSATDFKDYLRQQYAAGTPVTVWYVLATPETAVVNEPLRKIGDYADTVSGITIPTIAGANTLSIDTTVQPSEVTVNYKGWHPVADVHERENGQWD